MQEDLRDYERNIKAMGLYLDDVTDDGTDGSLEPGSDELSQGSGRESAHYGAASLPRVPHYEEGDPYDGSEEGAERTDGSPGAGQGVGPGSRVLRQGGNQGGRSLGVWDTDDSRPKKRYRTAGGGSQAREEGSRVGRPVPSVVHAVLQGGAGIAECPDAENKPYEHEGSGVLGRDRLRQDLVSDGGMGRQLLYRVPTDAPKPMV